MNPNRQNLGRKITFPGSTKGEINLNTNIFPGYFELNFMSHCIENKTKAIQARKDIMELLNKRWGVLKLLTCCLYTVSIFPYFLYDYITLDWRK